MSSGAVEDEGMLRTQRLWLLETIKKQNLTESIRLPIKIYRVLWGVIAFLETPVTLQLRYGVRIPASRVGHYIFAPECWSKGGGTPVDLQPVRKTLNYWSQTENINWTCKIRQPRVLIRGKFEGHRKELGSGRSFMLHWFRYLSRVSLEIYLLEVTSERVFKRCDPKPSESSIGQGNPQHTLRCVTVKEHTLGAQNPPRKT